MRNPPVKIWRCPICRLITYTQLKQHDCGPLVLGYWVPADPQPKP